jgi:hypothetical protein
MFNVFKNLYFFKNNSMAQNDDFFMVKMTMENIKGRISAV